MTGAVDAGLAASPRERAVLEALARARVLPLATLEPAVARPVGEALLAAGLPCIEIAFRNEFAAEAIKAAREVDGLMVGAGTVLSVEQVTAAAQAGAQFAVAPGTNPDVVACCRERGLPFFPGVATPTEIERARGLGLHAMKVFPIAPLGGPAFLRAVSATYPDVRFIPTGGIDGDTVGHYLAVRSVLACAGSWLIDEELVAARDFAGLGRRARNAMSAIG